MDIARKTSFAASARRTAGPGRPILRVAAAMWQRASAAFRAPADLDRLSARLRRDACIDEVEVERERQARAPLIR